MRLTKWLIIILALVFALSGYQGLSGKSSNMVYACSQVDCGHQAGDKAEKGDKGDKSDKTDKGAGGDETPTTTPQVLLEKIDSPDPVPLMSQLTFSLPWRVETGNLIDAVIIDSLVEGLEFVTATTDKGSFEYATSSRSIFFRLGDLAAGDYGTTTLTVLVTETFQPGDSLSNLARFESRDPLNLAHKIEWVTASSQTLVTEPLPEPEPFWEVSLSKTATSTAVAGETLLYQLNWQVTGTATTTPELVIEDFLPSSVSFLQATPTPTTIATSSIVWLLGSQTPTATGTIELLTLVSAELEEGTELINQASLTSGSQSATSSAVSLVSTPSQEPEEEELVTIIKSAPAEASAGETLEFTIDWQVNNLATTTSVTVVDHLPADLTFVSATPTPSLISGSDVSWLLAQATTTASGTISLMAEVAPSLEAGTIINNAAQIILGSGFSKGSQSTTTIVAAPAPESEPSEPPVKQAAGPSGGGGGPAFASLRLDFDFVATKTVGEKVTETITLVNRGFISVATGTITLSLEPAFLKFLSSQPAALAVNATSGEVILPVPALSGGQTAVIKVELAPLLAGEDVLTTLRYKESAGVTTAFTSVLEDIKAAVSESPPSAQPPSPATPPPVAPPPPVSPTPTTPVISAPSAPPSAPPALAPPIEKEKEVLGVVGGIGEAATITTQQAPIALGGCQVPWPVWLIIIFLWLDSLIIYTILSPLEKRFVNSWWITPFLATLASVLAAYLVFVRCLGLWWWLVVGQLIVLVGLISFSLFKGNIGGDSGEQTSRDEGDSGNEKPVSQPEEEPTQFSKGEEFLADKPLTGKGQQSADDSALPSGSDVPPPPAARLL